jgi:ABC-type nitrate/sulfonate/bicarbonate transport system permease component
MPSVFGPLSAYLKSLYGRCHGVSFIDSTALSVCDNHPVFGFIWTEVTGGPHGGVLRGQFFGHFLITLQRFGLGLVIAVISGTFLGILIGSLPFARALLNDTLLVFLALPAIIWAFLTTMWFGIGPKAPIFTTALTAAPFVAVNVAQGVRAITPDLHQMSTAYGVPLPKDCAI